MLISSLIGAIIGVVIATIVSGLLIWIVGKLGLGIEVAGFGPAFMTGFIIALLWLFATWLWNLIGYTPAGGISGAITHLLLTAAFLYAIRNSVSGLKVNGFTGALIAAAAIAIITWLANFVLAGVVPA